jgi:anti-sigma factor RsiW
MNHCPETDRIEAWLDGELSPEAARKLERHVAGCGQCGAELAVLRSLFASLRTIRPPNPGLALTERILDRVVPSRVRRRVVTAIGWSYTAVSAVTTFAFISWIVRPETHVWLGRLLSAAWRSTMDSSLFALGAIASVAHRIGEGVSFLELLTGWLGPVGRALGLLATDPVVAAALWSAVVASALTLWWMRPSSGQITRGNRNVGILSL